MRADTVTVTWAKDRPAEPMSHAEFIKRAFDAGFRLIPDETPLFLNAKRRLEMAKKRGGGKRC